MVLTTSGAEGVIRIEGIAFLHGLYRVAVPDFTPHHDALSLNLRSDLRITHFKAHHTSQDSPIRSTNHEPQN